MAECKESLIKRWSDSLGEENNYRFSVENRSGTMVYDRFRTLDDCFLYVLYMTNQDEFMADYCRIRDRESGLTLEFEELPRFHWILSGCVER